MVFFALNRGKCHAILHKACALHFFLEKNVKMFEKFDPFAGAETRLLTRGKEAPLRVNPEQAEQSKG